MKSKFFFLLFAATAFQPVVAQTKHALIFAIGNYPKQNGWEAISSNRDILYIKKTLLKQGFAENNIQTITDRAATPEGITRALNALIGAVKPGDIAVIHVSSHGEQVEDDNGDETDGLDETIVTYNALAPPHSKDFNKDQAQYYRDDQFGHYINQLRNKLGKNGDVVVFMDLCHSGTGTRGNVKVRGGHAALTSPNFNSNRHANNGTEDGFREINASKDDERSLATYVVFSAARAGELSYETKDDEDQNMGSLTYAITKVFENLDAGVTYRSLFAKIQSAMYAKAISMKMPRQQPVMEGSGEDRALFGGKFVQQRPYIEIGKIEGKQIILKSGKLAGLDSGAKVIVYPAGTANTVNATAMASGTVIKAGYFTSVVNLDKYLSTELPASGWVFISETVYVIKPIAIKIMDPSDNNKLKESLKDLPLLTFEGEPELILIKGNAEDSLKIAANDYLFTTINNNEHKAEELKKAIRRYAQYKFLQGLEIEDPSARIEVKLVPVINGKPDTTKINTKIIQGTYVCRDGDQLTLWVKNTGKYPIYFNVLDMQPDGKINRILPNRKIEKPIYPSDLKIDEGTSRLFDYIITISPPCGIEIFKLFASRKEIDMENIVALQEETTRGSGHLTALESMVKKSYQVGTIQRETITASHTDGSVYSLLFEIKPKK